MSKDTEFYVEKILAAQVATEQTRTSNVKKVWHYHVKWNGYPDLSWEPEENFLGSKLAIRNFWKRANLEGRDYKNLRKFRNGEVIHLAQTKRKRPGPGRSSEGLITGTRVFALWKETMHYYSAIVQRRVGDKYLVRWDEDEHESTVDLKHMRLCAQLRTDDTIILKSDTTTISEMRPDGTFAIRQDLTVDDIMISAWNINDDWDDRKLSHDDIVCAIPTGSRRSGRT